MAVNLYLKNLVSLCKADHDRIAARHRVVIRQHLENDLPLSEIHLDGKPITQQDLRELGVSTRQIAA